jgi:NADH-quinone oxidoreductase subunit A
VADILPIIVMLVVSALMAVGLLSASWLFGRVRRSKTRLTPYECGLDPMDEPYKRVSVRYYVVALLFLLFDVETLFLFPVAAAFKEYASLPAWSLFVYGEMLLFLAILLVGYVYALKKGALEWE